MRKWGFYPKLALTNILRSRRFYLPYFLACTGTAAMFYVLCFLTWHDMIETMPGAADVQLILHLGVIVVGLFSAVILSYTNSFVMKRRRREIGLYNILGMEKRHIARLLSCETLLLGVSSIACGLAAGILLSKLLLLCLLNLTGLPVQMGFSVSGTGALVTALLFAGIFVLTLLENLVRVARAKPIELLRSASVGEREPKTKRLLAAAGVLALTAGYLIANLVRDPISALVLFFAAVILVIIGTYCLFTAGSIALLKGLRAKKSFYYKPRHFTAVSGMLYRMKQNAVGLASICILSTMVLVTVSTTVCLYLGAEDSIRAQYPYDIRIGGDLAGSRMAETAQAIRGGIEQTAAENGLSLTRMDDAYYLSCSVAAADGTVYFDENAFDSEVSTVVADSLAIFQTADEYARLTGQPVSLAADEVLVWDADGLLPDTFTLESCGDWRVAGRLAQMPASLWDSRFSQYEINVMYLVVADDAALHRIAGAQTRVRGENASSVVYMAYFDLTGSDSEQITFLHELIRRWSWTGGRLSYTSRAAAAQEFCVIYGGFLFLGLFLGLLFLLATVLIIYYKQVSEGYEDCQRFAIMQKVGMSAQEVKASIRSQILMVFFLPLLMAGVHVLAAFNLIRRLLELFSLTNAALFALCTAGTLLCFAAVYLLVYRVTAKTYYKIVSAAQ